MNNEYKIYSYVDANDLKSAALALYGNMLMNKITFYDPSFNHAVQISATEFCDLFFSNRLIKLAIKYKTVFLDISIEYQTSKTIISAIPKFKEQQNDLSLYIKCVLAICENFFLKEFFTEPYYSLPTYE
ncbi:MAG: hypothetical protein ACOYT8_00570 [Candidatus Dependentiae bacterium]